MGFPEARVTCKDIGYACAYIALRRTQDRQMHIARNMFRNNAWQAWGLADSRASACGRKMAALRYRFPAVEMIARALAGDA